LPIDGIEGVALIEKNPDYAPNLTAKMQYWAQAIAQPGASDCRLTAAS
jgi:hypothetical protein